MSDGVGGPDLSGIGRARYRAPLRRGARRNAASGVAEGGSASGSGRRPGRAFLARGSERSLRHGCRCQARRRAFCPPRQILSSSRCRTRSSPCCAEAKRSTRRNRRCVERSRTVTGAGCVARTGGRCGPAARRRWLGSWRGLDLLTPLWNVFDLLRSGARASRRAPAPDACVGSTGRRSWRCRQGCDQGGGRGHEPEGELDVVHGRVPAVRR